MDNVMWKPEILKKMNISLIINTLINIGSATRKEISDKTKISITTIRTLIEELEENGDIIPLELEKSSGGRRALRYTLNPNKNQILSMYVGEGKIYYEVRDLLGNVLKEESKDLEFEDEEKSIKGFLSCNLDKWDIKAIGLGIRGGIKEDIRCELENKYSISLVTENDLNAMALGFSINYTKYNENCEMKNLNMAYVHFNNEYTRAGIIANGEIIHGANLFAGELGFIKWNGSKTLNEELNIVNTKYEFQNIIFKIISIIDCVVNPSIIVIGGNRFEEDWFNFDNVNDELEIHPKILISNHCRKNLLLGLYYITLNKGIELIK